MRAALAASIMPRSTTIRFSVMRSSPAQQRSLSRSPDDRGDYGTQSVEPMLVGLRLGKAEMIISHSATWPPF